MALSVVELLPVPSSFVCDGHFAASGPFSLAASCSAVPFPPTCSASPTSQSVVCPACNAHSPCSFDFLHFQHLCCMHHVEVPAGECMSCSAPQSMTSSLSVPCCRQRIHYECLARSVHSCGDRCPFCTQDLVPILSDPLVAASLEHLDIPIDFNALRANSALI